MQILSIVMPSGMTSRGKEFDNNEEAQKVARSFGDQMRAWKDFEAWILMTSEDGKEVSVEHIKTLTL